VAFFIATKNPVINDTLLAVRNPDILDFGCLAQKHLTFALLGIFPIMITTIIDPGSLHGGGCF